ncbi:MAG: tetratricopeptide repeat protein [Taibaiella sp.]|nr:tetratricopeptide repeat protein [Taibaiella sp.]
MALLCVGLFVAAPVHAQMGGGIEPPKVAEQKTPLEQAREYVMSKELDKAIALFQKMYEQNPADATIYNDYLNTLLLAKKYKDAEKVVEAQDRVRPHYPLNYMDMGRVYIAEGKEKKAIQQFDMAVEAMNGDDMLTQQMGNAFMVMGRDGYAIRVFERGKEMIGNPYVYAGALAKLYARTGNMDKAVATLMEGGNLQFVGIDNTKATLLELIGSDPKKIQLTQKALIKKINEQPENDVYPELLTWLYTQKNDWDGALLQIEALNERNREDGRRLIDFARLALKEKQYGIAVKAYDELTAKGKDAQLYTLAESEKLSGKLQQLENDPAYKPQDVTALETEYDSFFAAFPKYYGVEMVRDYAQLAAQFADDVPKGIHILQQALDQPGIQRQVAGRCKLQLGDYYILQDKVWDASLTYSQVDKDFKEDAMGEEARYRNARLAYYRGDFEWAQQQLSVLKASTTELIANDALYLSVLITENIGPDSNYVPLQRFAYADLLLFRNKDKEAETLLDSISTTYPKHPLNDDILMLHARIAEKHRDYARALEYLLKIHEQYSKDVLGDDAVYRMAYIYETALHQPDKAKEYYEMLITDYPGSTYVQQARKRLSDITNPPLP